MYEIDDRAQFVCGVIEKERRGGIGHTEGDALPLADGIFRREVVRKPVDPKQHLFKGILFPVIGNGGADGAFGNIFQYGTVHRCVFC